MIGPGSLPRYPMRGLRRPNLGYSRLRRRRRARQPTTPAVRTASTDVVWFDHGQTEFPMATLRPREPRARAVALLGDVQRWLLARWQWFKPRSVPCAVAGLGMMAVIAAAEYLAHHQADSHERAASPRAVVVIQITR